MQDSHFLEIEESPEVEIAYPSTIKEKLFSIPVDTSALQDIVLEYFAEQAYYKAWVAFEKETVGKSQPLPLLKERETIRELVEMGEFLEVVEKVSLVSPFIFTDFPFLYFLIIRQDILEDVYVRKKPESSAILRIEKELASVVEKNPFLLRNLETLIGDVVFCTLTVDTVVEERSTVFQEINKKILLLLDYEIKNKLKFLISKIKDLSKTPSILSLTKECPTISDFLGKINS